MKKLFALITCFALVAAPGCKSLLPIITEIISVASEAGQILDAIDAAADHYFKNNPAPEVEKEYRDSMAKARLSLATVYKLSKGAEHLNNDEVIAAFADFREAYKNLQKLLGPLGIVSEDGLLMAMPGQKPLQLPEPEALTFTLE